MKEVAIVILGVVVFLAFFAYADKQTDKDEEERRDRED
jgi:cellobiose-specific phosphotransferase system component IIC